MGLRYCLMGGIMAKGSLYFSKNTHFLPLYPIYSITISGPPCIFESTNSHKFEISNI